MINSFPVYLANKFREKLRQTQGDKPLERLRNYHGNFKKRIERSNKDGFGRVSIDDKLDKNRFFYFPGESPEYSRNCFERSVEFWMAANEIFPESSPKMLYINEGARGSHAITVFNDKGRLYGADPTYGIFGPAKIMKTRIKIEPDSKREEGRTIKTSSVNEVSENFIESLIYKLRSDEGLKYFLGNGGQVIKRDRSGFRPYTLFGKISGDTFTTELRFLDFCIRPNTSIRRNLNLRDKTSISDFSIYSVDNWSQLMGEKVLLKTSKQESEKGYKIESVVPFKDIEKHKIDEWIVKYKLYLDCVKMKSSKNHKRLEQSYLVKEMDRERAIEILRENYEDAFRFLQEQGSSFLQHCADYFAFDLMGFPNEFARAKLNGEKGKTYFREYRKKFFPKPLDFIGCFSNVFYGVSKKEIKLQRDYTHRMSEILSRD